MRYGIGVGREGFTWSGVRSIERKAEWPDWYPPAEMVARQPYLPRMTSGGPGNRSARAPCILPGRSTHPRHQCAHHHRQTRFERLHRLTNEDVTDLYSRVQVGAKVVVLPQTAVAQVRQASLTNAYAPQPQGRAEAT
jgi:hypothetical protein